MSWSTLALAMTVAPASGQEALKFSDLEGLEVTAKAIHDQVIRREGREFPAKFERDLKVVVGPGDTIHLTITPTVQGPRGRRQGTTHSGPFTLDQVRDVPGGGGGTGVWSFGEGALTFIRTFRGGAYRSTITFVRSGDWFSCTINEGFARESGRTTIALNSPVDNTPITIISSKQTSSRCAVKKT
jgi:hypothetical protein